LAWLSGFRLQVLGDGVHKMALSSRIRIHSWLGAWGRDRTRPEVTADQLLNFSGVEEFGVEAVVGMGWRGVLEMTQSKATMRKQS
jgi:hypothetical protein